VQSELPERLRLRIGYLVTKLYTRSLRTGELHELKEFAVMTARLPANQVRLQSVRRCSNVIASSAKIDIVACAKAGLVW
jgi:hypothetical protein